jgi:hypothetical protein
VNFENLTDRSLTQAAITFILGALLCVLAYTPETPKAAVACEKHVYPFQSLPGVANNTPSGTTFCIHDGTYKISSPIIVQSGDIFLGVYSDTSRPVVTTDTASVVHHVFDAGAGIPGHENDAVGATIQQLTISGAKGDDQCEPNCGRGIGGGKNLTVAQVRLTGNQNQGIGGTLPGLVVRGSIIDNNGSRSFSILDGGPSSTSGIKTTNSVTVLNSNIHHNWWNGVWCDEECGTFNVQNSTITDNGKAGISDEWSTGPADISGNSIMRNGWNNEVTTKRAGLIIQDSTRVDVYNNTFGSNTFYGIEVGDMAARLPNVSDVSIHDNTMNGNRIVSCSFSGVSCSRNN